VPEAAVKSLADRLAVTVVAVRHVLRVVCAGILRYRERLSAMSPDSAKFAELSVALVFPSYGLVGLVTIEAVSATAVMFAAVVGWRQGIVAGLRPSQSQPCHISPQYCSPRSYSRKVAV